MNQSDSTGQALRQTLRELYPDTEPVALLPAVRQQVHRRRRRRNATIGMGATFVVATAIAAPIALETGNSGKSAPVASADAGGCTGGLTADGRTYYLAPLTSNPNANVYLSVPVRHMHKTVTATMAPCNDSGGRPAKVSRVQVARIDSVDPATAIAIYSTGDVYLRQGAKLPSVLKTASWVQRQHA